MNYQRSNVVRRGRPVLLMAVFLSLVLLLAFSPLVLAAAPPEPTYGTAVVDGSEGEWVVNTPPVEGDFFADMYEAANSSKDVLSKAYLRYDCQNEVLYTLVLAQPGFTVIDSLTNEHFVKLGSSTVLVNDQSGNDGAPADFAFIYSGGNAIGWEASAPLPLGTGYYPDLNIHTQIDDGASQTSAFDGRSIELVLACTPTAVSLSGLDATATSSLPIVAGGITMGLAFLGAALRRSRKQ